MGLTNCFPGWFKGPLYRRSQMPGIIKLSEIRSEPVTTFSLNEHSSKLVSKFVSLDPCANAAVRPQQRRFFVSWMSVSTDTHRWSEHTACQQSARQQTEHLYQPLRLWGGGAQKDFKSRGGGGPERRCLLAMPGLLYSSAHGLHKTCPWSRLSTF